MAGPPLNEVTIKIEPYNELIVLTAQTNIRVSIPAITNTIKYNGYNSMTIIKLSD